MRRLIGRGLRTAAAVIDPPSPRTPQTIPHDVRDPTDEEFRAALGRTALTLMDDDVVAYFLFIVRDQTETYDISINANVPGALWDALAAAMEDVAVEGRRAYAGR